MTSPCLLNLESIEDRVVPAAISISYLGSAYVLQTNASSHSNHERASTPTITRAEVFRVVNDDGSIQYLLRTANWSGNWNQYLTPSKMPEPQAPRSSVQVPYSPNYRPVQTSNSSESSPTKTQQKSEASSEAVDLAVSVPFNFVSVDTQSAANEGPEVNQPIQGTSQTQRTSLPSDTSSNSGRRSLPLIGSLEVIEMPSVTVPLPPVEVPPNEGQPFRESAEPGLADIIPVVATQLANALPLTGLFPFNTAEVESGVRTVLDRVANLDESWVEESSGLESYLWLAAGTLVAGGLIQAGWSRRYHLTDRRVLGLDSVLARWGSPYEGRLGG